jgi:hypothetical protein
MFEERALKSDRVLEELKGGPLKASEDSNRFLL